MSERLMAEFKQSFLPEVLLHFLNENRCCKRFTGMLRNEDAEIWHKLAKQMNCIARKVKVNGLNFIKIHKPICLHLLPTETSILLHETSLKLLFSLHIGSDMHISTGLFNVRNEKAYVPTYRFAVAPLQQSMINMKFVSMVHLKWCRPINTGPFLEALSKYNLLVVNGDQHCEASLSLPLCIIKDSAVREVHCKIVCIMQEDVFAIYNAEVLADALNEKVGETIAYQIHHHSCISDTSNLIYTTPAYFLRVLMGQNALDIYRHISHIIIADVHLREPLTDILLCEIRSALSLHPYLRVLLLSNGFNNIKILQYFPQSLEHNLMPLRDQQFPQTSHSSSQPSVPESDVKAVIVYSEELRRILRQRDDQSSSISLMSIPPKNLVDNSHDNSTCNKLYLDNCLEIYEHTGTDEIFSAILQAILGEDENINYRHSVTGVTALIIAAKLGKESHVYRLLGLHADTFITDNAEKNALYYTKVFKHKTCSDILIQYGRTSLIMPDANLINLDFNLITSLIRLLTTSSDYPPGNIAVFLPDYEQLLRVNFFILREKTLGRIGTDITIGIFHKNVEIEHFREMMQPNKPGYIKIILIAEVREFNYCLKSLRYVIDSGRIYRDLFTSESACVDRGLDWAPFECLRSRQLAVCENGGICFRLFPSGILPLLRNSLPPQMVCGPLQRACLFAKLLSPYSMISEYLMHTPTPPSYKRIHSTVKWLQKIGVIDHLEDITWLGCRLIELPIDCQFAKALVFAVLLQCLDPVLTIVSFMVSGDPYSLPVDIPLHVRPYLEIMRHKIKAERNRLAGSHLSDHLMYIRIFQEWQNSERGDDSAEKPLVDEHHFIMNGMLERICNMRSFLVAALRSAHLIHAHGHSGMHTVNSKANCWPLVKAALIGGLYPNVGVIDRTVNHFKSDREKEIVLHPSSVLRGLKVVPLSDTLQNLKPDWIIYSELTDAESCFSVKCCTAVTALTVFLFAGPTNISIDNIVRNVGSLCGEPVNQSHEFEFFLDEWLWTKMSISDALLVLKTRQLFYSIFDYYLHYCSRMEKFPSAEFLELSSNLIKCLEVVLVAEDSMHDFPQPDWVGSRPKTVPHKFIQVQNKVIDRLNINKNLRDNLSSGSHFLPAKNFFIVHLSEASDVTFNKYSTTWLQGNVGSVVAKTLEPGKLTYVIVFTKLPEQLRAVALAYWDDVLNEFKLSNLFRNNIPIYELINSCMNAGYPVPPLQERRSAVQVDNRLGDLILNIFSNRNNLVQNI